MRALFKKNILTLALLLLFFITSWKLKAFRDQTNEIIIVS